MTGKWVVTKSLVSYIRLEALQTAVIYSHTFLLKLKLDQQPTSKHYGVLGITSDAYLTVWNA